MDSLRLAVVDGSEQRDSHFAKLILAIITLSAMSTATGVPQYFSTTVIVIHMRVNHCFPVFLANVNSRSRSLYAIARPSVCLSSVCNARAPYSGG